MATMLLTSFAVSTILHMLFQNLISARPRAIPIPSMFAGAINVAGFDIGADELTLDGGTAEKHRQ